MLLKDTSTHYGWISIALHWITAAVIVYMLFVGNSISAFVGEERDHALRMHTSVGVSFYVVLWGRAIWRFLFGHPGPLDGQRGVFFTIGKWVHYATLAALTVMLVTGPLTAWARGDAIAVFDWFSIPTPLSTSHELSSTAHAVHAFCAGIIFVGILLHLAGVYKHMAFNRDGTFMKMIVAENERDRASDGTVS